MMLSITKAIKDILKNRFHFMLENGAFPEVNYRGDGTSHSYYMMEYSTIWSTFAKVADSYIKANVDPRLGVFTRKHSAKVLDVIKAIVDGISEQEVKECGIRFKTWCD